jgi:hypothetical protein
MDLLIPEVFFEELKKDNEILVVFFFPSLEKAAVSDSIWNYNFLFDSQSYLTKANESLLRGVSNNHQGSDWSVF